MQGVELVFHQAALASVPRSVADPLATHQVCVTGTINVLDQARQLGVRRVMYAASSSAYGNSRWSAKREADPTAPLSPYAAAKLAGEKYCQSFFHSYGLETVCLRYFNVFGPRQDPNGPYAAVIPAFILKLQSGERPVIFGDGKQSRDFTFIGNVVAGNLAAATAAGVGGKVFNVASGRSYSLLDLVDGLNKIMGLEIKPILEAPRVGDVKDSLADISLAAQELGYAPSVEFSEGLRQTVRYYSRPAVK
jgi:UDP-glucose 4-epimerase